MSIENVTAALSGGRARRPGQARPRPPAAGCGCARFADNRLAVVGLVVVVGC